MKQLQLKKMTLACGMALGALGLSQSAFAVTDLFLAGSTALDPNIERAVADMCNPSLPADKYASPAGTSWSCTAKSGLTFVTAGEVLNISKENLGGSGNGIGPVVAGGATLARPGTTGCTGTGSQTIGAVTFTTHTGCVNAASANPKAGISDVEPRLFGTNSGLSSSGIVAVQFGVAMSEKMYRKLQVVQGISESSGFDPNNAPSLKSSELRGMMSGNLTDWTGVSDTITPAGTGTTSVKICRRGTTSGTQKSFEVRMLGLGCAGTPTANSGAILTMINNTSDDATNNGTVTGTGTASGNGGYRGYTGVFTAVLNNGSKEVDRCLTDADNQDELAIGFLGTDRISGAPGVLGPSSDGDDEDGVTDKWHFVKLDNVFPSVPNLVNGSYDNLWTQATLNRRPSGYTAAETALMNEIGKRMGDPTNITNVPFPGIAALPSNGYTWDGTAPIVRGERRTSGGDVNNCQESLVIF